MFEISSVLHVCTKSHNHMIYGCLCREWEWEMFLIFWTIFCPFLTIFCPDTQNFEKMKKNLERLAFYTCYNKWRSCDKCFFRYEVLRTEFFVTLVHFLLFSLLTTWEIKNLKRSCRCYHFTHVYHKWGSYEVWFLRYEVQQA